MTALIGLPILLPLLGAAASIGFGRSRTAQRVIGLATLSTVTVTTAFLLARVDHDGITAVQAGGWVAPIGISLVADRLAAVLLLTALVTLLAVLLYAIG